MVEGKGFFQRLFSKEVEEGKGPDGGSRERKDSEQNKLRRSAELLSWALGQEAPSGEVSRKMVDKLASELYSQYRQPGREREEEMEIVSSLYEALRNRIFFETVDQIPRGDIEDLRMRAEDEIKNQARFSEVGEEKSNEDAKRELATAISAGVLPLANERAKKSYAKILEGLLAEYFSFIEDENTFREEPRPKGELVKKCPFKKGHFIVAVESGQTNFSKVFEIVKMPKGQVGKIILKDFTSGESKTADVMPLMSAMLQGRSAFYKGDSSKDSTLEQKRILPFGEDDSVIDFENNKRYDILKISKKATGGEDDRDYDFFVEVAVGEIDGTGLPKGETENKIMPLQEILNVANHLDGRVVKKLSTNEVQNLRVDDVVISEENRREVRAVDGKEGGFANVVRIPKDGSTLGLERLATKGLLGAISKIEGDRLVGSERFQRSVNLV